MSSMNNIEDICHFRNWGALAVCILCRDASSPATAFRKFDTGSVGGRGYKKRTLKEKEARFKEIADMRVHGYKGREIAKRIGISELSINSLISHYKAEIAKYEKQIREEENL